MGNDRSWFPTFGGLFDVEGNGNQDVNTGLGDVSGGPAPGMGFNNALCGGMVADGMGTVTVPGSSTGLTGV